MASTKPPPSPPLESPPPPVLLESQKDNFILDLPNSDSKPTIKRSSSASNDALHERDRFRARFRSLNTASTEACHHPLVEKSMSSAKSFNRKTKKLSASFHDDLLVLELLHNYSLSDTPAPLDASSAFFKNYLKPATNDLNKLPQVDIRVISVAQLSAVFKWYFNKPLPPTNQMFPWLHGLHPSNFTQRSFFMCLRHPNGNAAPYSDVDFSKNVPRPKDARFLMCIEAGPSSVDHVLHNTVALGEVLRRIEYSKREVFESIKHLVHTLFPLEDSLNTSAFVDTIVSDCLATGFMPTFLNLDPDRGISLRNFHIQVAKLAHCADFIVYDSADSQSSASPTALSIARLLRLAQMLEENDTSERTNVFLLSDNGESVADTFKIFVPRGTTKADGIIKSSKMAQLFFNSYTHFKNHHVPPWDAGFQLREKLEASVMSSATRIHNNVWLGNIWDHEIMAYYLRNLPEKANNLNNDLAVPKVPSYCDPSKSTLFTEDLSINNFVSFLSLPKAHWKLFVHCHNDASFPESSVLSHLLFKYTISSHDASEVEEFHHLDFPSLGSIGIGDCKLETLMCIVNTCKLLYLYSSTVTAESVASLIYCSDGYTELSLLTFCYMMYAENLPLNEVMVKVHKDCGRPFYIFGSDVIILRKLETLLRKFSPKGRPGDIDWSVPETISNRDINTVLLGSSQPRTSKSIPKKLKLGYIANSDLELSDTDSDDENDDDNDIDNPDSYISRSWVERAEGSFPSRILPYLYLGSLKHADSLALLSKIGVKRVISVGESLTWLHGHRFRNEYDVTVKEADNGNIEVYRILAKQCSNRKGPSRQWCTVETVVKVNNLQDDGIDELTNALPSILQSIDEELKETGGETKILVHCRVGVSRLATVVIAEVMRRLGLDLPSAYLFVRVRRLNIVIQPNLRFMYELFKWEEQEKEKSSRDDVLRRMDWFMMCREIERLNLPFLTNRMG